MAAGGHGLQRHHCYLQHGNHFLHVYHLKPHRPVNGTGTALIYLRQPWWTRQATNGSIPATSTAGSPASQAPTPTGTEHCPTSSPPQLPVTPSSTFLNGMHYRLVATATNGTILTSSTATLTIMTNTLQPTDQSTAFNGKVSFTANVTGAASYQWQIEGTDGIYDTNIWIPLSVLAADGSIIADGTVKWSNSSIPQLTVNPSMQTIIWRHYRLLTKASNGTTLISSPATLTILSITSQPTDQAAVLNGTTNFTATAAGAVIYQWQWSYDLKNWAAAADGNYIDINGKWYNSRTSQLTITPSNTYWNGLHWRLVATASNNTTVTSNIATLTVNTQKTATSPQAISQDIAGAELYSPLAAISVYPNPTRNTLHIDNLEIGSHIALFDMLGKKTGIDKLATSASQTYNISTYAKGIYLLRITSPNGMVTNTKVLKQ